MPAAPITSLQNPRIKAAARLRDRRERFRRSRLLIDGAREILVAAGSGVELVEVFVCPALCKSDRARAALAELQRRGIELVEVSSRVLEKLSFGQRAEGLVAVAAMRARRLADLVVPENPLVAVLEGIEKPGNLGAVLRSADAAGLSAVVVTGAGTDLYNPNAIRASLGTVFTSNVCAAENHELLDWLQIHRLTVYAARPDASGDYTAYSYRGPTAFVLGAEAAGLTADWAGSRATAIRLPMHGMADSLNLSVAAAVLFYEALRQRQPAPDNQPLNQPLSGAQ